MSDGGDPGAEGEARSRGSAQMIEGKVVALDESGIDLLARESVAFEFEVPSNAVDLVVRIRANNGVADLYTRYSDAPTTSTYDCRPFTLSSNETCSDADPGVGKHFVMVRAYRSVTDLTLEATYEIPASAHSVTLLDRNGLQGDAESEAAFEVEVPQGASDLRFVISGGSGDSDLYVRYASPATTSQWDCRPYSTGNEESCMYEEVQGGTYHVLLHGYTVYTGISLKVTYTASKTMPPDGDVDCEFTIPTRRFRFETNSLNDALIDLYTGLDANTFYCDCEFNSSKTMDTSGCGYRPPSGSDKRASWEHVVPAFRMNRDRPCRNQCGGGGSARDCCRTVDAEFRMMEGDLRNILPAASIVNSDRGSLDFGIVEGESRRYGACDFEVDGAVAEPRPAVRGDIARIYLYFEAVYGMTLTSSERAIMVNWNEADVVDEEEFVRNNAVDAIQGNTNPYVEAGYVDKVCLP